MERARLVETMESILGPEGVISEREELRAYECDGLMNYQVIPDLVVLPESAEQVQRIVRVCYEEGIPFVARGKFVAVLPGSEGAVRLAVTKLLVPELGHIVQQLSK